MNIIVIVKIPAIKKILTANRDSSNRSKGPVVPTMTNGCPAMREKTRPAMHVDNSVSDMPIWLLVLSPAQLKIKN
jgi:hypothetical protein